MRAHRLTFQEDKNIFAVDTHFKCWRDSRFPEKQVFVLIFYLFAVNNASSTRTIINAWINYFFIILLYVERDNSNSQINGSCCLYILKSETHIDFSSLCHTAYCCLYEWPLKMKCLFYFCCAFEKNPVKCEKGNLFSVPI